MNIQGESHKKRLGWTSAIVLSSLIALSCSSSSTVSTSSAASSTSTGGSGSTETTATTIAPGSTTTSTASTSLADAVQEAYASERTALATYENVVKAFGDRNPFSNVITSERQHVAAIEKVAADQGVTLPTAAVSGATAPGTFAQACTDGVAREQEQVAMYDRLLPLVASAADVTLAFTNLRKVSLENHLVAFQKC